MWNVYRVGGWKQDTHDMIQVGRTARQNFRTSRRSAVTEGSQQREASLLVRLGPVAPELSGEVARDVVNASLSMALLRKSVAGGGRCRWRRRGGADDNRPAVAAAGLVDDPLRRAQPRRHLERSFLGSALTHHPHVHMIVRGGGISLDGKRWVSCRPGFFLPVRVLSRLFRRLFLEKLVAAHQAGELQFFGNHAPLIDAQAFAAYLAPLRNSEWVVYSKRPFGGPKQVLRYLARYTHRVAISNSRLIALDDKNVTFKWKDYRLEGRDRYKAMTLATHEFIRRFLIHVLPSGFHRIRYYGLFASTARADNIARARELLAVPMLPIEAINAASTDADEPQTPKHPCPCCGGRMIIIETFERGRAPRYRSTAPTVAIRVDTS